MTYPDTCYVTQYVTEINLGFGERNKQQSMLQCNSKCALQVLFFFSQVGEVGFKLDYFNLHKKTEIPPLVGIPKFELIFLRSAFGLASPFRALSHSPACRFSSRAFGTKAHFWPL